MLPQSDLPCWEIIQCNREQNCLFANDSERECWEVVRDDDACSFHICVDCLVYLVKQKDSRVSEEKFFAILSQRKAEGI
ncbi:MAG: hypothetical protein C0613_05735 [Desulfobulbaceae bacterium]|nr:MAG: hypothetical protein C0613_05735 [Desulfobulbaceae bacterium]